MPGGASWAPVAYPGQMKTFLTVLIALLMFATLGVLIAGMVGLVRGGGDPRRSNKLMQWRIILQGAALLLFALLMTLLRS
jgi:Hypoxia induced protein conserved region